MRQYPESWGCFKSRGSALPKTVYTASIEFASQTEMVSGEDAISVKCQKVPECRADAIQFEGNSRDLRPIWGSGVADVIGSCGGALNRFRDSG